MKLHPRWLELALLGSLIILPATARAQLRLVEPPPMNAGGNGANCGEPAANAQRQQLTVGEPAAVVWQGPPAATYQLAVSAAGRNFQVVPNGGAIRAPADDTSGSFRAEFTVPNQPCDDCIMRVAQLNPNGSIAAVACGQFAIVREGGGGRPDGGLRPDSGGTADAGPPASADSGVSALDASTSSVTPSADAGMNAGMDAGIEEEDEESPRPDAGRGAPPPEMFPDPTPQMDMTQRQDSGGGCRCVPERQAAGAGASFLLLGFALMFRRLRRSR